MRNCCCCCCCSAFGVGCEERTIALPLLLPGCSKSVLLCPAMSVGVLFVPVFWVEPGWICLFSPSSWRDFSCFHAGRPAWEMGDLINSGGRWVDFSREAKFEQKTDPELKGR